MSDNLRKTNGAIAVPKCGASDKRNLEYEASYSPKSFFDKILGAEALVIIDIGAHRGESIHFFKDLYPNSIVYSFEPSPDNYAELIEAAKKYDNVHSFDIAIGESNGLTAFYRQDISHLGGLLPINKDSTDSLGYAKNAKNELIEVRVSTLDAFCIDHSIQQVDIIKIDTQGYEYGVLKGARNILRQTKCVMVEISLYDFYGQNEEAPLLNIEQIMFELGFEIWDISKISKNPKSLRTDWIEVVYRNMEHSS